MEARWYEKLIMRYFGWRYNLQSPVIIDGKKYAKLVGEHAAFEVMLQMLRTQSSKGEYFDEETGDFYNDEYEVEFDADFELADDSHGEEEQELLKELKKKGRLN